jgi:hypothetical protein
MATKSKINLSPTELDKILSATGVNKEAFLATIGNESEVGVTFDATKPTATPAEIKAANLANVRYEGHRLFQGSTEKSQIPGYETRFGYLNQQFKKQGIPLARQTQIVDELRKKYPLAFSTNMSTADILQGKAPSKADITNKKFHGIEAFNQGNAMVAELNSKYGIQLSEQVTYANTSTGVAQILGDEVKGTGPNGSITLQDMKTNFANDTGDKFNTESIQNYFNQPVAQKAYASKPTKVIIPISSTKGIEVTLPYDPKAVGEYHNGKTNANARFLSADTINLYDGQTKTKVTPTAGVKFNYIERLAVNTVNEATRNGKATPYKQVNLPANYLRTNNGKENTPKM